MKSLKDKLRDNLRVNCSCLLMLNRSIHNSSIVNVLT